MTHRFLKRALIFILCAGMLVFSTATGFSKPPGKKASLRKPAAAKLQKAPQKLILRSASVLVEDQKTGERLIQKQAAAVVPIASITKLMTAMVVLDAGQVLEERISIEAADIDRLLHSRSHLPVGTRLTRKDALLIALMASENRSAHALGRTYPGGYTACVAAMNAKARALGLRETRFSDTTGLSSGNVSSARDLVRLVDAAYSYRPIRQFTTCRKTTIVSGCRVLIFSNTNRLIQNPRWEIGLSKTGYTDEAGRCLVMQAHMAKRPVLIILLDSQGKLTRVGDANRIKKWLEASTSASSARRG
ncbi:MAG: serine hydrolase [Smithellaceae bacterium]|nr:serine hydrolase [Syntrophaceae bacterium]MDD4240912.1 serine hydrolase [Smithellaceae bacterium]NLX53266.1 peptidase S11 [Deltaproteobacteria bacterium]